jgi:hypothetical protein
MNKKPNPSAIRQALKQLESRFANALNEAMRVRKEVMPASLSKTHKICGNPNCKCARGEKHVVFQLSWAEDGKRRCAHIRAAELSNIQAAVARYRHLRKRRADLLKAASEGAALIDSLIEALTISPPDRRRSNSDPS